MNQTILNNKNSLEQKMREVLAEIGEDPNREGLLETPKRIVKAWAETLKGYDQKPEDFLKVFTSNEDQMIISRDIEFYSYCEHHFIPFFGHAHVAYLPAGKVIGLSKIARLVDMYARRLQIQEKLTSQVANSLNELLEPKGVAVIIEGQHMCQSMRGIQKKDANMVTSCMLGAFREDAKLRDEFLQVLRIGK